MSSSKGELNGPCGSETAGEATDSSALVDPASGVRLLADDARAILRLMVRTMVLAERLAILGHQNKFPGGSYGGTGAEAIDVASAYCLSAHDVICPPAHNLGAALANGLPLGTILREYVSPVAGAAADGNGGSLHAELDNHVVASVSQLAEVIFFIAGAVWSEKRRGQEVVGLTYVAKHRWCPDDFNEALNFAAQWKLPVAFLVNNGRQGDWTSPGSTLADYGRAYGTPCFTVDGADVLAAYGAVRRAVARARRGDGPSLIESVSHLGDRGSEQNGASHVPRDLRSGMQNKELVARFERVLVDAGILGPRDAAEIRTEEERRVLDALRAAEDQPAAGSTDPGE